MNILNLCDDVLGLIEHQTGILRETKTNKINMNTVIKQISGGFEWLLYDTLSDRDYFDGARRVSIFGLHEQQTEESIRAVLRHYEVSEWVEPGDVSSSLMYLNDFTP
jgi:hypothetical protein|tara:strand:- start:189 stop:509 length:321 start_codon:yes stop_codon:yes gene_type:complete